LVFSLVDTCFAERIAANTLGSIDAHEIGIEASGFFEEHPRDLAHEKPIRDACVGVALDEELVLVIDQLNVGVDGYEPILAKTVVGWRMEPRQTP
jgi:hypothetical protein